MDKLGTYALVAALKEISQRKNAAESKPPGVAQNERWISLRSCAKELPMTLLEPEPRREETFAPPAPERLDRNGFAEQRLAQSFQTARNPQTAFRPANAATAPSEPAQPLSTLNKQGNFSSIRQIEMRHMAARRGISPRK